MFNESFDTEQEARFRALELELDHAKGILRPPQKRAITNRITLSEYLDIYVNDYGKTHWGDSQYSVSVRNINNYIKPSAIASILLCDLRTSDFDSFYNELLQTPAVLRSGHKSRKPIGISVIAKIHALLHAALNKAISWEYITNNPADRASLPSSVSKPRQVWTPEQAQFALNSCQDSLLKNCLLTALGCSLRIGELLGLTWDNINITADSLKDNSSTLTVAKEIKRCTVDALNSTSKDKILFTFPDLKIANPCKTKLVLKVPKTDSSMRTIYIPNSVAQSLLNYKADQEKHKAKYGPEYNDYNLVFCQPNGRPLDPRFIQKRFDKFITSCGLPKVVFHSLRHLSTSLKLKLSKGDIKAVQGDTGHSQASMVTQVYAHTFDQDRHRIAAMMEDEFFDINSNKDESKIMSVLSLLKENPELTDLIIALSNK